MPLLAVEVDLKGILEVDLKGILEDLKAEQLSRGVCILVAGYGCGNPIVLECLRLWE
jgi:hypothetical protein